MNIETKDFNFINFYKDKKVLVTGHTGFKGSWLSIWLNMLGAKVTGFCLPARTP
jgi:CDP-glucose 4,6-dehydratase